MYIYIYICIHRLSNSSAWPAWAEAAEERQTTTTTNNNNRYNNNHDNHNNNTNINDMCPVIVCLTTVHRTITQ